MLTIVMALATGCSPFRMARASPTATPLALSRCAQAPGILCIATFGMMPQDQMLVAVRAPLGGLSDIHLRVTHLGTTSVFPCVKSEDVPDSFNCTGPVVPLGSTIRIDVLAAGSGAVLASGDFFLAGFAIPTVPLETPPPPGTAYPNR